MATKLKIKIEQVKLAMQSGSVENGNTTMEILKQKNRADVLSMFYFENDEERMMVDSMLTQANIIIGVTNKIGKINVKAFREYVKKAYMEWVQNFGKYTHMKNSLHWTLGHVAD